MTTPQVVCLYLQIEPAPAYPYHSQVQYHKSQVWCDSKSPVSVPVLHPGQDLAYAIKCTYKHLLLIIQVIPIGNIGPYRAPKHQVQKVSY